MRQKCKPLIVCPKLCKHRCFGFYRESAAARFQPSRHDGQHCRHIGGLKFPEILRRDLQITHTLRDAFRREGLPECRHQDRAFRVCAELSFDFGGILFADRPDRRRLSLPDLRKIAEIVLFPVIPDESDQLRTVLHGIAQPFPLCLRCDELRIRILGEEYKGNVQTVLEYPPLKPEKFGVFLRILSQMMQHRRAGTVQMTDRCSVFCHCVNTSHNYILALYYVKVKPFFAKSDFLFGALFPGVSPFLLV